MIFRVTFKSPDALDDAWNRMDTLDRGISRDGFMKLASKWVEYGEYVTIEIDAVAKTCAVVPVKLLF